MAPPVCLGNVQFLNHEDFAKVLVEQTIQDAINFIHERATFEYSPPAKPLREFLLDDDNIDDFDAVSISEASTASLDKLREKQAQTYPIVYKWPNIKLFDKCQIMDKLREYVSLWELKYDWLNCVDFLKKQTDSCSDYYIYEIKFSIPTKEYPIPQVTASAYFKIEVSRVKPLCSPIEVTYMFEGSRLIHKVGKLKFNEQWLLDILNNKLIFFQSCTF